MNSESEKDDCQGIFLFRCILPSLSSLYLPIVHCRHTILRLTSRLQSSAHIECFQICQLTELVGHRLGPENKVLHGCTIWPHFKESNTNFYTEGDSTSTCRLPVTTAPLSVKAFISSCTSLHRFIRTIPTPSDARAGQIVLIETLPKAFTSQYVKK